MTLVSPATGVDRKFLTFGSYSAEASPWNSVTTRKFSGLLPLPPTSTQKSLAPVPCAERKNNFCTPEASPWNALESLNATPMKTSLLMRARGTRSEEHTSELQSRSDLVCRLLLE